MKSFFSIGLTAILLSSVPALAQMKPDNDKSKKPEQDSEYVEYKRVKAQAEMVLRQARKKSYQRQANLWSELMKQKYKQRFRDNWRKELKMDFSARELPKFELSGIEETVLELLKFDLDRLRKKLGEEVPGVGAVRDVFRGLKTLNELLTPEDWRRIQRLARTLASTIKPEDLGDQAKIMRKLQGALSPSDMGRFFELLSDFLETEEGQALESRLEKTMTKLEEFMASDRGQTLIKTLKELFKQFQRPDRRSFEKFGRFFGRKPKRPERGAEMKHPKKAEKAKPKRKAKLY